MSRRRSLRTNSMKVKEARGSTFPLLMLKNVSLKSNKFSEVYLTANKEQCDTV